MNEQTKTDITPIDGYLAVIASYLSTQKTIAISYQYDLGKVNGKVAYIMYWIDNNVGAKCNETGVRGQIYYDRGDSIKRMENKGYEIKYLN